MPTLDTTHHFAVREYARVYTQARRALNFCVALSEPVRSHFPSHAYRRFLLRAGSEIGDLAVDRLSCWKTRHHCSTRQLPTSSLHSSIASFVTLVSAAYVEALYHYKIA
jgi:hypothetical protein